MINDLSKRIIPFRPHDAKRVGSGCFYLDSIVWLNGDRIEMGDDVIFNYGVWVNGYGGLVFGDRAAVGPYAMIHTASHNYDDVTRPILDQGHTVEPVEIGADAWLAMGVIVLPGVRIGEGCIVGAGSVVTKDLEPWCLAVGNPARPIRSRRPSDQRRLASG